MRPLTQRQQEAQQRLDAGGWGGNGASLPPVGMNHNNAQKGWTEEQHAAAEEADQKFLAARPRHPCGCGCRVWKRTAPGERIWCCQGCGARDGAQPVRTTFHRPGYAPAAAVPTPNAEAARAQLEGRLVELAQAKTESAAAASAEQAARTAVSTAELAQQAAEAALNGAMLEAGNAAAAALRSGRTAAGAGLSKIPR